MYHNYADDYLKLIIECGKLIESGILIGEEKMPFTLIDFYNLVGRDLYDKVDHNEIKKLALIYKNKYQVSNKYLNLFLSFIENENKEEKEINNPMEIINQFTDKENIPAYEDVNMIMNIFDIYAIPKNNRLINQALQRFLNDFPIFPLLLSEEEKKLGR